MATRRYELVLGVMIAFASTPANGEVRIPRPGENLGEIRAGQRLTHRFEFCNDGPGALEVIDVRTGCGCLAPRVEPRVLQPGTRGVVTVDVNSLGQAAGPHTWKATLQYRQGDKFSERELELRANIITEVTVQPASLTLFIDGARTQEIVLTDLRPQPLTVTAVRTRLPALRAVTREQKMNAAGQRQATIVLDVGAELADGRHEDMLDIYTDDPVYAHLQVPVRIVKEPRGRISLAPKQVAFSIRPGQASPARLIRLWDAQDEAIEIAKVWADDPALSCTAASGPGHHATLKIQVDSQRLSAGQSAVHIELRRPVQETITIPVMLEP
jgi:hypothetical protein